MDVSTSDSVPVVYCQVCSVREKQYKCPRCGMFTCSLVCCKQHKKEQNCNGQRDVAAFVSQRDFKAENLRSDYHFLENVLQTKDSAKRILHDDLGGHKENKKARKGQDATALMQTAGQNLDSYTRIERNLVNAAKERGVKMILLPPGMWKRAHNSTTFTPKKNKLVWKVHLLFVLSDKFTLADLLRPGLDCVASANQMHIASESIVSLTLDKVEENQTLEELLNNYLDPKAGNSIERHTLKPLRGHRGEIECLIQRIPSPANNPLFAKMMLNNTISQALNGQTVIEYPTFIFGWSQHVQILRTLVTTVASESSKDDSVNGSGSVPLVDYASEDETEQPAPVAQSSSKTAAIKKPVTFTPSAEEQEEGEIVDEGVDNTDAGDEDEEEDDQEEFFRTLQEFEGADINTLKAIISKEEEQLLS